MMKIKKETEKSYRSIEEIEKEYFPVSFKKEIENIQINDFWGKTLARVSVEKIKDVLED